MAKGRYDVKFLTRSHVDASLAADNIPEVKRILARTKKTNPAYLRRHDIYVEDTEGGPDFTVDQDFKLTEM